MSDGMQEEKNWRQSFVFAEAISKFRGIGTWGEKQ